MAQVMRPCIEPSCPRLTTGTRCKVHERANRRRRKQQGLTGKRGSTTAWRRLRRRVIARAGYRCEWPGCDKVFPAHPAEVHHKDGNSRNNSINNLEALCHDHHVEAERQKGSSR